MARLRHQLSWRTTTRLQVRATGGTHPYRFPTSICQWASLRNSGFSTGPSPIMYWIYFLKFSPEFLRPLSTHLRLGTRIFRGPPRSQRSTPHCMFSRHVSLSHRPMKEMQKPSCLCLSRERTHQTGGSRTITNHFCLFSAEPHRNSPDALGCVISSSTQDWAHRFCVGRRISESRTDVKPCLGLSFQENARAWLSDNARLLIISTPEDHIRPSHSYITFLPVRALDFMVYCIRGSGATGPAYRRCMGREPLAWSTICLFFFFVLGACHDLLGNLSVHMVTGLFIRHFSKLGIK